MKRVLLIVLAFVVFSCTEAGKVISEEQYLEYLNQSYRVIPDSLMTDEQKRIREEEMLIVKSFIAVDDGKLILTIGREYYSEHNIPEYYYDLACYEIHQDNELIAKLNEELDDSNKIDVQKLVDDIRKCAWHHDGHSKPME